MSTQLLKSSTIPRIKSAGRLVCIGLGCALTLAFVARASSDNLQDPPPRTIAPAGAVQPSPNNDANQLRKTVDQLNAEVARLKNRVAELEKDRQVDSIRDTLGKEQQRAELLHTQLLVPDLPVQ